MTQTSALLIQLSKAQTAWGRPRESPTFRTSGTQSLTRETPTSHFLPGKHGTPFSIEPRSHLLRIRHISYERYLRLKRTITRCPCGTSRPIRRQCLPVDRARRESASALHLTSKGTLTPQPPGLLFQSAHQFESSRQLRVRGA